MVFQCFCSFKIKQLWGLEVISSTYSNILCVSWVVMQGNYVFKHVGQICNEVHIHWNKMYQKCCCISLLIPRNDGWTKTHLWTISGNFFDVVCTSNLGNFQRPNTKRLLCINLGTTRLRGRPRNRWQDEVREDGRVVGGEGWQEKVSSWERQGIIAFCTHQWNKLNTFVTRFLI